MTATSRRYRLLLAFTAIAACLLAAQFWYASLATRREPDAIESSPRRRELDEKPGTPAHGGARSARARGGAGRAERPTPARRLDRSARPAYLLAPCIGRFGNNLFQYASTYSLAMDTNRTPAVRPECHARLTSIVSGITAPVKNVPGDVALPSASERHAGRYSAELLATDATDSTVCCYLQSWRYFDGHAAEIRKEFTIREGLVDEARKTMDALLGGRRARRPAADGADAAAGTSGGRPTVVGVHVRRDDFASAAVEARGYWPAPRSYFLKAMDYFRRSYDNDTLFVVCSDQPDWAEDNLRRTDGGRAVDDVRISRPSSISDFALLVLCDHIIMSVGSYGWWASWLNGGTVVYYDGWPRPGNEIGDHYDVKDYYYPTWIGMGS